MTGNDKIQRLRRRQMGNSFSTCEVLGQMVILPEVEKGRSGMEGKFYEELSKYYDDVFPPEQSILAFLADFLPSGGRVLDLACGTGTYTIALSKLGIASTGIELDATMVAAARGKDLVGNVTFIHGDMMEYNGLSKDSFEGVFCIGNSLPHLQDHSQVARCLHVWDTLLAPSGVLILQTVNFSRFARGIPTNLPSIKTDRVEFIRRYLPLDDGKVSFETELRVLGRKDVFRNAVDLLVLDKPSIESELLALGYHNLQYFGGYGCEGYDPGSSFLLIVVASKSE